MNRNKREFLIVEDFDNPAHWLVSEQLNLCGCGGRTQEIRNLFYTILKGYAIGKPPTEELDIADELARQILNAAGLIEHSGSIYSGWLTTKGREVCQQMGITITDKGTKKKP